MGRYIWQSHGSCLGIVPMKQQSQNCNAPRTRTRIHYRSISSQSCKSRHSGLNPWMRLRIGILRSGSLHVFLVVKQVCIGVPLHWCLNMFKPFHLRYKKYKHVCIGGALFTGRVDDGQQKKEPNNNQGRDFTTNNLAVICFPLHQRLG